MNTTTDEIKFEMVPQEPQSIPVAENKDSCAQETDLFVHEEVPGPHLEQIALKDAEPDMESGSAAPPEEVHPSPIMSPPELAEGEANASTAAGIEGKSPIEEDEFGEPILEPNEDDILNGRGASVNARRGNTTFRALCFARKPEFEAGNHAAKRRIATEIVNMTPGRFLKRKRDKGAWYEQSREKAILKACQVMRDFQRPDRVALREMATANGAPRKRQRSSESTPGVNAPLPAVPLDPIVENPYGVHDHDVLSGRGAFVNGHIGNQRFRQLAIERKPQFDVGTYADKRVLATEIVGIVRSLDPPGRFLKRITGTRSEDVNIAAQGIEGDWEELSDDRAIHKACQVMRDLHRPDRTGEKKARKGKEEDNIKTEHPMDATAIDEAVLATEDVLDKTLAEAVSPHMMVPPSDMEVDVGEAKGVLQV